MSYHTALELIESVKDYRVQFVGDRIIDEYLYVKPLGKSPKENLIPVSYQSRETFEGGVHAAAKHLETFCASVKVDCSGPITRKVRMVDANYLRKLFEVHYNDGEESEPVFNSDADAIVVTDFGHGAIRATDVDELCRDKAFLAVNAQTNSANLGFNLITKYPRADYIVIDEPEARLAACDRDGPIEDVILKLAKGRCKKMIVTHGAHGAVGYDEERGFRKQPSFTNSVVDTMGAGDAFFAVTAPMAKTGSIEDLLLIGNAAGAMKTQIVGHRASVTKDALVSYLKERAWA